MPAAKRTPEPAPARIRAAGRHALPQAAPHGARRRWTAAAVFAGLFAVYVLNFRVMSVGDSLPTRVLPFSVLREGNFDLDEFGWPRDADGRLPYYVHQLGPHVYSVSTIAAGLIVTPLYVLPAWWLSSQHIGYDDVRARVVIVVAERIAAATLAALSASVLFVVLCGLTTTRWALFLTLVYGLGTSTWSISSQALWPHALSALCIVLLSWVLLRARPSRAALLGAGVVVAVMLANRPQMIAFALPALLFVWMHRRWDALIFAAPSAVGGAFVLAYNRATFGGFTGGYGGLGHFNTPLLSGLSGLLLSPNRGLFVYTPLLAFAFWGAVRAWRTDSPPWVRWLTVGLGLHLVIYAKFDEWWGGYTFGPRYFTDVLPVLTILLVYGLVPLCRRRAMQVAAALLAVYGVGVQAIGTYAADDRWEREPIPLERSPERVWDWSDLQIARALHGEWRGLELAHLMVDAFRDPVPARIVPLTPAQLANAIEMRDVPAVVRPGERIHAVATLANRSDTAWPAFSGEGVMNARNLVFLLVRWLDHGSAVAGAGDVIPLPEDLAPGERVEIPVAITAPRARGPLQLELRVTQAVDGTHGLVSDDTTRVPVRIE
jgi:hypothetical protein